MLQHIESMVSSLKESGLSLSGKVSPAGKLYAKIDNKTIAQELTSKYGFSVDAAMIKCDKFDHVGQYEIKIIFEKIKSSFILTII